MIKIFVIIGILVLSVGTVIFYRQNYAGLPSEPVVVLYEDGFKPDKLTIRAGQRVTFINKSGRSFWPASDDHPTHELYPEFDAKEPISNNLDWSFVFEKPGIWPYHDHTSPYLKGVIEVK